MVSNDRRYGAASNRLRAGAGIRPTFRPVSAAMRRQIPNAGYSSTNYRGAGVLFKRERLHYSVPGSCPLSFVLLPFFRWKSGSEAINAGGVPQEKSRNRSDSPNPPD